MKGEEILVDPATWVGTRDRSWGYSPQGEPEPAGRWAAEPEVDGGSIDFTSRSVSTISLCVFIAQEMAMVFAH